MDDLLPSDPKARRHASIAFAIVAVAGTAGVWWLTTYLETLTTLAQTDRETSLHLFRTRVVPVLAVIVLGAVLCGAILARQGARILQSGQFPPPGTRLIQPARPQTGGPARVLGVLLTATGTLMAIIPLVLLAFVLWSLRE